MKKIIIFHSYPNVFILVFFWIISVQEYYIQLANNNFAISFKQVPMKIFWALQSASIMRETLGQNFNFMSKFSNTSISIFISAFFALKFQIKNVSFGGYDFVVYFSNVYPVYYSTILWWILNTSCEHTICLHSINLLMWTTATEREFRQHVKFHSPDLITIKIDKTLGFCRRVETVNRTVK